MIDASFPEPNNTSSREVRRTGGGETDENKVAVKS